MTGRTNPFPAADPDRHSIWEMLVSRDISAFVSGDWDAVAGDFLDEAFVGYSGTSNPDHWNIKFPDLRSYREEWLRQAASFRAISLANEGKDDFLFRATILRDIEIAGDHAQAHKKFDARAPVQGGPDIVLNWQTIYWLRRTQGRWRIAGFLGYLPNPMPQQLLDVPAPAIRLPAQASQHETAGPYSPVLCVSGGSLVAISGQGPIDVHGHIGGGSFQEQVELTLENCQRQLEAAGAVMNDVFKVTVYLSNMNNWGAFNEIYRRHFSPPYPVRTAVQAVLWGGIQVEIDMLAALR